jgi:outer membrane lipoprotein-sorting protein
MVTLIRNLAIIAILVFSFGCKTEISEQEFLRAASDELSRIKSASYYMVSSSSAPGDTMKL